MPEKRRPRGVSYPTSEVRGGDERRYPASEVRGGDERSYPASEGQEGQR